MPSPAAPPDAERLGASFRAGPTPEPAPAPELLEQLAEALYNSLDPRFVDCEWQYATEGSREWARRRAQRLLAESGSARDSADGQMS